MKQATEGAEAVGGVEGGVTKINRFPQWRTFCARCSLRLCLPKDGPEAELQKKSTSFFYEVSLNIAEHV